MSTGAAGIVGSAPIVEQSRAPDYFEILLRTPPEHLTPEQVDELALHVQASVAGAIEPATPAPLISEPSAALSPTEGKEAHGAAGTCDDPSGTCSVNPLVMPHSHITGEGMGDQNHPDYKPGQLNLETFPTDRPPENELYEKMWSMPEYRKFSPGENVAQVFLEQAQPRKLATVLDLGCGTGRGGYMLAVLGGMNVTFVDFAGNALDEDILPALESQSHVMRFVKASLAEPLPMMAEYGFCTDVMEHIPPEQVKTVLINCLKACQHVFFQIATEDDVMGKLVGHALHLSVHPFDWWLKQLQELDCVVHWSKDTPGTAMFYVTAWSTGHAVVDYGVLNTSEEQVKAQVRANITHGCTPVMDGQGVIKWEPTDEAFMQIVPHETNDMEVMVLGGGPSLALFEDEIRQKRKEGAKLVTMNGAYNWCLERGIGPISAQIVVDGREFNSRFTRPVSRNENFPGAEPVKYLIASQVHPDVLEGLPVDSTWLWHTTADMFRDELNARYARWYGIPGGSTVLLRALPLLRVLGFHQFHLYGVDSCIARSGENGEIIMDHAYAQPENPAEKIVPVNIGGKVFACYMWHVAQAQQFIDLIRFMGHEMELNIPGDGLLAFILAHGAAEFDKSVFLQ